MFIFDRFETVFMGSIFFGPPGTLTAAETSGAPHLVMETDGLLLMDGQKYNLRSEFTARQVNDCMKRKALPARKSWNDLF